MATQTWGECKSCKSFEIEPEAKPEDRTMGLCIVPGFESHKLRVSGVSGCNLFEHGHAVHAKGASEVPPNVVHLN